MIISHESALSFWRKFGNRYAGSESVRVIPLAMTRVTGIEALDVMRSYGLDGPLHVMISHKSEYSTSTHFTKHVFEASCDLPCVVCVSQDVYVVSPELCLLQMAQHLDSTNLIKLGYEFCGTYMPDDTQAHGCKERPVLTTPGGIMGFADRFKRKYPGLEATRVAIRFVSPHSNSPVETALAMLCTLPYRMGGYGLPRAELNQVVRLSREGARIVGRTALKPDLLWRDAKVALEYNSAATHTNSEQREFDDRRNNVFQDKDFRYFIITPAILRDPQVFDAQMHVIARAMGKRIRIADPSEFARKHLELRAQLAPWLVPAGNASRYFAS